MMSRVTTVSASAKARSVASSSPASQVGLARLSRWPALSSRISGASGSSALRALTIAGSGSYSTSISCERVVRRVLVGRDHERDLLALEADLVARQHGLRVVGDRRHPGQAERLEVLGRDDRGDVRVRERPRGVDRDDPRVGVRAAQQRAVDHARQPDVVEVGALAADEARVLLALQPAEADRALGVCALGRFSTVAMLRPPVSRLPRARPPSARRDDVLVPRAAADRAGDRRADLLLGRIGVLVEQRARGHQHAGRAEAALQRVQLVEALLDRVELAVDLERLDRADLVALAHRRQDRAGLDRLAVHLHDAGAAVRGVAAPVRAGQPERLADEVDEQHGAARSRGRPARR